MFSIITKSDSTTTAILTATITASANASLARQKRKVELSGKSVPWYAWACDVERYAEVCSCAGFPAATITESAEVNQYLTSLIHVTSWINCTHRQLRRQ